jgi:uncharacterized protein YcbK (DUF882 family)
MWLVLLNLFAALHDDPIAKATSKGRALQSVQRSVRKSSRPSRPSYPPAELFAANLGERLQFRPYDARGRTRKGADRELAHLLRCRQTGARHRVPRRLMEVIYAISRHYPGRRIEIFSGYRPRKYCTRAHSRHLNASAIDFRIPGVKNESLIAWLRSTFHPVGVGYYPNGVHVHLDVDRDRDTYWVDAGDAPTTPLAVGDTGLNSEDAMADEEVDAVVAAAHPADPGPKPKHEQADEAVEAPAPTVNRVDQSPAPQRSEFVAGGETNDSLEPPTDDPHFLE